MLTRSTKRRIIAPKTGKKLKKRRKISLKIRIGERHVRSVQKLSLFAERRASERASERSVMSVGLGRVSPSRVSKACNKYLKDFATEQKHTHNHIEIKFNLGGTY